MITRLLCTLALVAIVWAAPARAFTPENGFYWNPAEPGRGYNIEIQDNFLALTVYAFAQNGSATWFTSAGPMQGNSVYNGTLDAFTGGQCLGCNFTPTVPNLGAGGAVSINFTSEIRGTMTLGGRTIPIERFDYFLTRTAGDVRTEMMLGEWQIVLDLYNRRNVDAGYADYPYYGDIVVFDAVDRAPATDLFTGCRPTSSQAGPPCDATSRSLHDAAGFYSASDGEHVIVVKDVPATATTSAVYLAYYVVTGTYQFDGFVEVCAQNQCGNAGASLYPVRGFRTASRSFVQTGTGPSNDAVKLGGAATAGLYSRLLGAGGTLPQGLSAAEVKAGHGIDIEALAPQTNALIQKMQSEQ